MVSVVIPCRGHADVLARSLAGLRAQRAKGEWEVIVVDGDEDPAVAAVVATFPGVKLVRSAEGALPGRARNLGVEASSGETLAFLDADAIPEPGWLEAAEAAIGPDCVIAGGPVLDALPYHPVAVADNLLQFYDHTRTRRGSDVNYFPGCNFAIRRDVFDAAGGFRPDLPAAEDSLLTHDVVARHPGRVAFVPAMRIRHPGRSTWRDYWDHQRAFGYHRGRLRFLMRPFLAERARFLPFAIGIAGLRIVPMVRRIGRGSPLGVLRILVLLPFLIPGIVAWGVGLHRGCVEAHESEGSP